MSKDKMTVPPQMITEKLVSRIGQLEYQNAMLTSALEVALANQKEDVKDGDTETFEHGSE